jgi:hypothetical protein
VAVEMGSGAMIHIPRFVKTVSGIQNLLRGDTHTNTWTHRQQGDLISLVSCFQNKGSRLIRHLYMSFISLILEN